MSQDGIRQVLGRAILDEAFRRLLFDKPAEALLGYELDGNGAFGFAEDKA